MCVWIQTTAMAGLLGLLGLLGHREHRGATNSKATDCYCVNLFYGRYCQQCGFPQQRQVATLRTEVRVNGARVGGYRVKTILTVVLGYR